MAKTCVSAKRECSVILDRVVGKRLAVCPCVRKVLFSRESCPSLLRSWNMCGLDSAHCDFHGVRLKFEGYGIDSLRVVWVCPKITDLSFLEGGVHG